MNCETCLENLSAYIDHALASSEMEAIENHLKGCPECHKEYGLLKSMVTWVGSLEEVELPTGFHEKLMMRIETETEAQAAKKQTATKVVKFRSHKWIYWAGGAAATLLIGMTWLLGPEKGVTMPESVAMKQSNLRSNMPMEAVDEVSDAPPVMTAEVTPMALPQPEEWTAKTQDVAALVKWLQSAGYEVQETMQAEGTHLFIQEVIDKQVLLENLEKLGVAPQVEVSSQIQSVTIFIKK